MTTDAHNVAAAPDMPAPSSHDQRDVSRPRLDLGKLREIKLPDLLLRFAFGGAASVLAALIAHWTTQRFGGIFTALPAVLLASLTLIGQRDGDELSAEDAEGGVVGACAFVGCAALLAYLLPRLVGALALPAALAVWLVLGLLLYWIAVRAGWLRTQASDEEQPTPREQQARDAARRPEAPGTEHADRLGQGA
jgi:hypothetical protein